MKTAGGHRRGPFASYYPVDCKHGDGTLCLSLLELPTGERFAKAVAMDMNLAYGNLAVIGWHIHWSVSVIGMVVVVFFGDSRKMMSACVLERTFLRRAYLSYACSVAVAALSLLDLMLFIFLKHGRVPYFWLYSLTAMSVVFGIAYGAHSLWKMARDFRVYQVRAVMES